MNSDQSDVESVDASDQRNFKGPRQNICTLSLVYHEAILGRSTKEGEESYPNTIHAFLGSGEIEIEL